MRTSRTAPPGSPGVATHASCKPGLPLLKHSEKSESPRKASSRGQSSSRLSAPVQPENVRATTGLTRTSDGGSRSARLEATVPDPNPSCRHATSASFAPKPVAQTWLQEPSKNTSRRPICQFATSDCPTSRRSPPSAKRTLLLIAPCIPATVHQYSAAAVVTVESLSPLWHTIHTTDSRTLFTLAYSPMQNWSFWSSVSMTQSSLGCVHAC